MTRTPDRAGRAPSGPAAHGSAAPDADPAGTPPPPVGVPAQTSGQAQAPKLPAPDGTPGPETARPGPAAVRVQSPAGGERVSPREASSSSPAGSSGAEWRKRVKDATSALHAEQRRRATRYTPRAKRGAGAVSGPGMVRRPAPETPGGDAA